MKTILLDFQHQPSEEPMRARIEAETAFGAIWVRFKHTLRSEAAMYLSPRPDGSLVNDHGCVFVRVKADRRPKPYKVRYDGMDGSKERKFATLAEVQAYVKARWQGVEYIPGLGDFHTDYGYYTLTGCTLADLGARKDEWDWTWKDLGGAQ